MKKLTVPQVKLFNSELKKRKHESRGFQVVSTYEGKDIKRPFRATAYSAAYDIRAAKTMKIPSVFHSMVNILDESDAKLRDAIIRDYKNLDHNQKRLADSFSKIFHVIKPTLVPTGIKAFMKSDEVLLLFNRSSNPLKRGLYLANGVGVIDADYYNNDSNEGELFAQLVNFGPDDYTIHRGDRIMQGMFQKRLLTDDDPHYDVKRAGGFGSSGK